MVLATRMLYRTMHVSRSKTNIELCDHNYSQQRCPDLIKHAFYVYNYGWGRYSEVWGVRSGVGGYIAINGLGHTCDMCIAHYGGCGQV